MISDCVLKIGARWEFFFEDDTFTAVKSNAIAIVRRSLAGA